MIYVVWFLGSTKTMCFKCNDFLFRKNLLLHFGFYCLILTFFVSYLVYLLRLFFKFALTVFCLQIIRFLLFLKIYFDINNYLVVHNRVCKIANIHFLNLLLNSFTLDFPKIKYFRNS